MATAAVQSGLLNSSPAAFVDIDRCWFFQPLVGYSKATLEFIAEDSEEHRAKFIAPSMERLERLESSSSSGSSGSEDSSSFSRSSSSTSHTSSDPGVVSGEDYHPDSFEMKRVFDRFDENNDGLICYKDLHKFMKRLGFEMTEDEALSLVKSVDHNDDGCVDFHEFSSLYKTLSDEGSTEIEGQEATEDEDDTLCEAFKVFDKNDDGFISALELQTVLSDLGLSEGKSLRSCERMIQRVSSDGNVEIDISEFKSMMCSKYFQQ